MSSGARFRMGSLDHVHIRVPDRSEAAAWYSEHLGFAPAEDFAFWASGIDGGPLQFSAAGGRTTPALSEVSEGPPMVPHSTGVAFSVAAGALASVPRSPPCR